MPATRPITKDVMFLIHKRYKKKTMKTKCVKCGRTYINTNDLCTVCRGKKPNPFDILENIDDEIELEPDYLEVMRDGN